jgi:glycosyltransferase involved in cell wall biosynthesis
MKILVVQDFLRSGGTERQSVLLANAFAAAGHETMLLTFRPGGPLAGTVGRGVILRSAQSFDSHVDWFAPGLHSIAARFQPDVIFCMGRIANCFGRSLQTRSPRAAVVATMRTGKRLPFLYRRSLQAVRHVVANSHEAKQTLIDRDRVAPEKIAVIHNGLVFASDALDPAAAENRERFRAQLGATPRTTVLLCVAMFRPEKKQRELIQTIAALPAGYDWQLWLAGDGPARGACERLVAARNLGARVKFLGFHRDPSPLYRAADIAVHASESEALSNFLIEAQAGGLPAVAFAAQGIQECFLPEETGWMIRRGDAEAFRAALERLMSFAPSARLELSAKARRFARETFDPSRQVESYLDLFARLTRPAAPLHDQQAAH